MKVDFDEIDHFHPYFDESAPNRPIPSRKTDRSQDLRALPSLEPMILSRIMPTYSLLFFEVTIFRNFPRFEVGRNFIFDDENFRNRKPREREAWIKRSDHETLMPELREETIEVSGTTRLRVENRHQRPLLPGRRQQKRMANLHRQERVSETGVHLGH